MDADFETDLDSWLNATADRYVVRKTLKESPGETTQIVYRHGRTKGELVGPFVRKRFVGDPNRGQAYDQLWHAQTMGKHLEHLPMVYECEHSKSTTDVIMEYLHGRTLYEVARQDGAGLTLCARMVPQLCDAVTQMHESFDQPIIHRDIKPSNVMVCDGRVVLIDLGIARTYSTGASHDTTHYGTPGYAPPEQFGYAQTNTRSDVYALGMTIAFCLTGQDPTPELRERGFADSRIPAALREVLVRATEFDPAHRHQSARELRLDFERAFELATDQRSAGEAPHTAAPRTAALHATAPRTAELRKPVPSPEPMPEPPKTSLRQRLLQSRALAILGRIWNVALVSFVGVMLAAVGVAASTPTATTARMPTWFVWFLYVFVFLVPGILIAYALLDKRRLRKHRPFCRFTWPKELLVCVAIAVASILVVFVLYGIVVFPTLPPD